MTSRQPQHSSRRAAYTTVVVAFLALVACLGLTTAASAASASASTSTAPYCGLYWGSLAKEAGNGGATSLAGVRTGRHDCYDRLVLDLNGGPAAAYHVEYVDAVYEDGSGKLVPLRGGARLSIVVYAPSYDIVSGRPTYTNVKRDRLPDVPPGRLRRRFRGTDSHRAGCPGAPAVRCLHSRGPRFGLAARHRRRALLVNTDKLR